MRSKLSVVRQIVIAVAIATVVIGVFIYLATYSTRSLSTASEQASRNQQVLSVLDGLLLRVQDAELGHRGYLLSGEDKALEPLTQARASLDGELSTLGQLVSDDLVQQQRVEALRINIGNWLESVRASLEQRRRSGAGDVQVQLLSKRAERVMEGVRSGASALREAEREQLRHNEELRQRSNRAINLVFSIGGLVAFIVFVLIGFTVGRSIVVSIGEAVTQVQDSSTALQSSATQQAAGAREQAAATTEISTTVKQLLSTAKQIAGSAQQVLRVADDTSGAARTGSETMQHAQEAIEAVSRQVDAIVNHMLALGKRSQEIGGILDIINELAEQTNILAINATIESAGAGEHGKRFAVVAEEVRKLADRVGSATKDIRVLIDEIRAASNTTIMATEDGSKAVHSSTKQFTEVAGSFRRIAELVHTNLDAAREIELSTQQQTTAVEQVNTAILEVAQAARQSESSSEQTLKTATRLIQLSQELRAVIGSRASSQL